MTDTVLHIEKELLQRISQGDEKAFRIFFDMYKERFYAVVIKMTRSDILAQEIVQEIFLHIWLKREKLVDIENPSSYFFTAVYRRVYAQYKKMAIEYKLKQLLSTEIHAADVNDELLLQESERLINEAIHKLPRQQQLVFRLSREEGLSRDKIAEQLNISPNTVKNHMADAMKFIRSYLDKASLAGFYLFWLFKDRF